jgi:membrane protein DedA with SNARE-associated domain/membrane-associated phospholipid phosphatase
MHATLSSLLASYGYVVLFLLVTLESLGIPLPGETALVTAAAFAAAGHLSISGVIMTAVVAAILGDNGGYWIGRAGGPRFVRRYGRMLHIRDTEIERAQAFFARHGAKTVFCGRFIALLRTWAAVLAGVSAMPYGVFMVYNALGSIVWAVLFGTLGYLCGQHLPTLEHYIGRASLVLALVVALVVVLVLAAHWFRTHADQLAQRVVSLQQQIASFAPVQRFRSRHPRAWEFVMRRFARGEYLGLHLTIGLVISLAALWLFGGITEDVLHHDPLTQFDLALLAWFHGHAAPTGVRICVAMSWLGSPAVLTALGLVVAVVLLGRRHMLLLGGWVATLVGGGVLEMTLKYIIQRPRPVYASTFLSSTSWSFPSGHAMGALIGYGMLAYLLVLFWAQRRRTQLIIVVVAALLTVAIGVSRLYLGVHYFSDVVAGYAAGLLWLSACLTGLEMARRQRGAAPSWDESRCK